MRSVVRICKGGGGGGGGGGVQSHVNECYKYTEKGEGIIEPCERGLL